MKKNILQKMLFSFLSTLLLLMLVSCGSPNVENTQSAGVSDVEAALMASDQRGAASVSVEYEVQDDWGTGFTTQVTIKNNGTAALNGWTLTFTFPGNQKITNSWNADVKQSGAQVTAKGVDWNSTISPGSSVSFGFQGTYSGSNSKPSDFAVNGGSASSASSQPASSSSSKPTSSSSSSVQSSTPASSSSSSSNSSSPSHQGLIGWATVDGGTTGGGNATPQRVTSISELRSLAKDSTPRVLELSGTFSTGSSALVVSSNKTLIGLGKNTTIKGGISIADSKNIIIKNLIVLGAGKGSSPADAIGVRGSKNLWFDHLTVSDAADGILDLTRGTDHATVSWCKFYYTDKSNSHRLALLFGGGSTHGSTDKGKNNHTIHHNWFGDLVDQRMPRLLFGKGHIFNNYFNAPGNTYCIGSGSWASLLIENNYFENVNDPHRFQDKNPSHITARGNIYKNCNGKTDTGAGGSGSNPPGAWTNPPYPYTLDAAADIPALVKKYAGPQ